MPRRALDLYETPPHYVRPLLKLIGSLEGCAVYEPCVGHGHIAKYLTGARHLCTNDIDPSCEATLHLDARDEGAWPPFDPTVFDWKLDWTITNPPFSVELEILKQALAHSRNVAFLARISFLEPTNSRAAFWYTQPPTDVIVLPRYSFRMDDFGHRQTDTATCVWIIWREGRAPCLHFSAERG